MESDTAVVGRMVLFVSPLPWIENELIPELVRSEYQACTFSDHASLIPVVKSYPGAIVIINIDAPPEESEWYRILTTSQNLLAAQDVRVAVLSEETRKPVIEKWLRNVNLACGFISSRERKDSVRNRLFGVISEQKANGRRKHVRADCREAGDAKLNIRRDNQQYTGTILDISSAGMACTLPEAESLLQSGNELPDIQLKLKTRVCPVSGHVAGIRQGSENVFVVMFDDKVPATEEKIYDFIQRSIQRNFNRRMGFS